MDQNKEQRLVSFIAKYLLGIIALIVVAIVLAWFFIFRSPQKTSTTTSTKTPKTSQKQSTTSAPSTPAATITSGKNLSATGPASTAIVFVAATIGGTIIWEWRLRHPAATPTD